MKFYYIDRTARRFEDFLDRCAQVTLLLMMLAICVDAIGRYFLSAPLSGAHEVVELYFMVGVIFLAMPRNQAIGGNIAVKFIESFTSKKIQHLLETLYLFLGALLFLAITYMAINAAIDNVGRWTYGAVKLPTWPSWAMFAVGSFAMSLRLILQVVRALIGDDVFDELEEQQSN